MHPTENPPGMAIETVLPLLAQALCARGWALVSAESCTGGLIAARCTDLPGSSRWFDRGLVTYSNAAKTQLLGVDAALIAAQGAVSEAVARAMAEGAVAGAGMAAGRTVSVAVTGIAGPGGASAAKPVGTVWLAWHVGGVTHTHCAHFAGNRAAVRQQTVQLALQQLLALVQNCPPKPPLPAA